jgi:phosphate transport system permease protein
MTLMIALFAILGIAAVAGWFARSRATGIRVGGGRLHSLPNYHGFHVVIWAAIPALLFLAAWMPFQGEMVYRCLL